MTNWTLIFRSLRFHARSHLGALLGAAIGSAVLIGALIVGDSVRGSLRDMALARLGKVQQAMATGDRFVREELATELKTGTNEVAAVLQVRGTFSKADRTQRANQVRILGVAPSFWKLAEHAPALDLTEDTIVVNQQLAQHLNLQKGETILLRVQKPSLLSREAPISPQEDFSVALRLQVQTVVNDEGLGRFSLQANQVAPFNAFVSLALLQKKLDLPGKANLLLADCHDCDLNKALRQQFSLADAELVLRPVMNNAIELRSPRIFLDEPVAQAAEAIVPGSSRLLTYFVNELRVRDRATPYSMVTAAEAPLVPADLAENEIILNQWLAEDLQAKAGDQLQLRYFVVGTDQRLDEQTNTFRVKSIVPLTGQYADRDLMPEYPGIAKAEKTENWDAGFSIDMKKIRPKDETYWKEHRGTPKAFIHLKAGQSMWGNRFGNLTAIRFPASHTNTPSQLEVALRQKIQPGSLGLRFEMVRDRALAAASQSEDFGGLFLGFSFFLIIAAILLMALMFQFGLEQRAAEVGTLLALGFTPKKVRGLLLLEGLAISVLGGMLGGLAGICFAKALLQGLTTIWRSAVGTSSLQFHVTPLTLVIGFVSSVLLSTVTVWWVLRKQARQPARELLNEGSTSAVASTKKPKRLWSKWIALVCGAGAIALLAFAISEKESSSAENFFSAGMLFLISSIAGAAWLLRSWAQANAAKQLSLFAMAVRNATRRRNRSLATIALLASGTFLIASIGAFKLSSDEKAEQRSSGTGGFALLGETTLPVVQNLNEQSGREFFGINENTLTNVSFVPFRVHEGDDASCLNLNRAQQPRLLGVRPEALQNRRAFTFAKLAPGFPPDQGWLGLQYGRAAEPIPAIGDEASITWALHKKIGDTLDYIDERGNTFKIRIVGAVGNSILQGSLFIDEAAFKEKFPSESGHRMFLIDAPRTHLAEVSKELSRGLQDVGLELTPTTERLAAYNAVQNTYLNTFQILGGLGLLLGSAGLGVVVLRNVLERRSELAVLMAVGFRKRSLRQLVLVEHALLLIVGLVCGVLSALLAILPVLISPRGDLPYRSLALTLGAVLLSGLVWTWIATRVALRGEILKALRNE
jgi:putative ABC transport system permease protein